MADNSHSTLAFDFPSPLQLAESFSLVGQIVRGVFLYGYFILDKQNKVTRQQGEKQCL